MGIYWLLVPTSFMAGLGIILSIMLVIAKKKFYVFEDPRIGMVENLLPSANCGACGYPGCRLFAENVVTGQTTPGKCSVSSSEDQENIAEYLGIEVGEVEKQVARLACAGGKNVARQRARYEGLSTCRSAILIGGGGKGCSWGCLGLGDCEIICNFDAITMNKHNLPVVDTEKCTACGDCVDICPLNLFSIHPVSHQLWVACKNMAFGDMAENECSVACTACGKCAADADDNSVTIENNLAVVNYEKNESVSKNIIQRCPTGAIVWIDDKQKFNKGSEAKKVFRQSDLPLG